MNSRVSRGVLLVAISVALAISGCGDGGDDTTATEDGASTGQQGTENGSTNRIDTQPEAPCTRVSDALVKRIEQALIPERNAVATTWQMVHSEESFTKNELEEPFFVSASIAVDKNPPSIATWTVGDASSDPIIPLDGVAKSVTTPEEGIDPTEYSDLLTEKDYVTSRSCVQQAVALEDQKREQRKHEDESQESEDEPQGSED